MTGPDDLPLLRDIDAMLSVMIQSAEQERPAHGAEAIAIRAIIALSLAGAELRRWPIKPGGLVRTEQQDLARQLMTDLLSLRDRPDDDPCSGGRCPDLNAHAEGGHDL